MTSSAAKGVMALFESLNIDLGENGLLAEASNDKAVVSQTKQCDVSVLIPSQRNESSETEYQRVKAHYERKRSLGHRLVVLRNYIKRCYGDKWVNNSEQWSALENWLDCALKENDYDIERAIDYYRSIAPEPKVIDGRCKCGYMPPFCNCK